jgi:multicomponent Na+:H+ antiporter subunit G
MESITWVLLSLGGFVALTGAVGVLRFPDFYSRLHPAGTADSLAQLLIMIGLVPQVADLQTAAKLVMISILLFITTPTATHAISQAAYLDGLEPWLGDEGLRKEEIDG